MQEFKTCGDAKYLPSNVWILSHIDKGKIILSQLIIVFHINFDNIRLYH